MLVNMTTKDGRGCVGELKEFDGGFVVSVYNDGVEWSSFPVSVGCVLKVLGVSKGRVGGERKEGESMEEYVLRCRTTIHYTDYVGGNMCDEVGGQHTIDDKSVTCPKCLKLRSCLLKEARKED